MDELKIWKNAPKNAVGFYRNHAGECWWILKPRRYHEIDILSQGQPNFKSEGKPGVELRPETMYAVGESKFVKGKPTASHKIIGVFHSRTIALGHIQHEKQFITSIKMNEFNEDGIVKTGAVEYPLLKEPELEEKEESEDPA